MENIWVQYFTHQQYHEDNCMWNCNKRCEILHVKMVAPRSLEPWKGMLKMRCTSKIGCQVNLHLREESARREEALEREVWIHIESRFTVLFCVGKLTRHVFPGENGHHGDSWFPKIDGFFWEEKKGIHWKRFPGLWTGIGNLFGWLALIDMVDEQLAVNFIPQASLIEGKDFGSSRKFWVGVIWWAATQHGHMMWYCFIAFLPFLVFKAATWLLHHALLNPWEPAIFQGLDPHFYPIHPHQPWVVICQTIKSCINFYLRCKFRSWILV